MDMKYDELLIHWLMIQMGLIQISGWKLMEWMEWMEWIDDIQTLFSETYSHTFRLPAVIIEELSQEESYPAFRCTCFSPRNPSEPESHDVATSCVQNVPWLRGCTPDHLKKSKTLKPPRIHQNPAISSGWWFQPH